MVRVRNHMGWTGAVRLAPLQTRTNHMNNETKQRRLYMLGALTVAALGLGFVSFGNIGENLVYYWDPTQLVAAGDKSIGATIRLGGVVKEGSMNWNPDASELEFVVSDGKEDVVVQEVGRESLHRPTDKESEVAQPMGDSCSSSGGSPGFPWGKWLRT